MLYLFRNCWWKRFSNRFSKISSKEKSKLKRKRYKILSNKKKKLDDKVRDRVLEIIATFALSFQNRKDFPGFEHTYIQLKRLPEINFPSVDPGAIFVPPSSNYQSRKFNSILSSAT